ADWIASFGPDGMLYDQIGGMPAYPCFDESHPHLHSKPSLSYTQGRLKLLDAIRGRAKGHADFGFMSEHITDLYSQYLDVIHGIGADPSAPGSLARVATADERGPEMVNFPALFRYCFPETMITLRNPRPYLAPRAVNYAFLFGFKYEMELRYLDDQSFVREGKHADWKDYAAKVTALRLRHKDLLLRGKYRDEAGLVNGNPRVTAAAYVGEDGAAGIALWNDTDKAQAVDVSMPGFCVKAWDSVNGGGEGSPAELQPGGIALLLCEEA
ncbi:MAG TPA: hypothetical protein PKE04_23300, partial [Clostridia bacterium]|nr:hypothetical protein [Clostridia bacterium]